MRTIHTLDDLHAYVDDIVCHHDPYSWESLDLTFDEYVDIFTDRFRKLLEEEYKFEYGNECPDVTEDEWLEIQYWIDENFGEDDTNPGIENV